jgi:serine/threonine protein kinase
MPPTHISHYRLTELLGSGTYGEVWKGVHVDDPNFVVAVKLVHPSVQGDPSFISALREECRALDRMDHPGIVRFRELVVRDGVVAMVLELLEGEDLEAVLAAGPQPIAEVERVVERALEGLAYAHAAGVLHRDIKPGNLFRCRDGRVKLMDFGLARAIEGSNGTKTGTLKGTMDYMAPERFRGQTSAAADVYALGLVAWELLAGRRAAPAGDLPAKMGWHWSEGPPDVRTVRADCPAWLASLVSELTSREVTARPSDGSAALARLRALRGVSTPGAGPAAARPVVPETVEVRLPTGLAAALPSRNIAGSGGGSVPPGSGPRAPGTVVAALPLPVSAPAAGASPSEPWASSSHKPPAPSPVPVLLPVLLSILILVGVGSALVEVGLGALGGALASWRPGGMPVDEDLFLLSDETGRPDGDPGGTTEFGPAGETTGSLALTVNPPGLASVKISKVGGGFEKVWNSTGKLGLLNLPEGMYETKVTPLGASGWADNTVEVKPGQTCAFTYRLSSQAWEAGGCY